MNFTEQLNEVGIVLNDTQRSQFDKYFEILVEWNGFMNLTGITEYEEVLVKHFLDSLAVGKYSEKFAGNPELSIIDVGTGGGFPGVPLAIAFPDKEFLQIQSLPPVLPHHGLLRCIPEAVLPFHRRYSKSYRTRLSLREDTWHILHPRCKGNPTSVLLRYTAAARLSGG